MAVDAQATESATAGQWTVEGLVGLELREVVQLFSRLEAPMFTEMNGEYEARLLDLGHVLKTAIAGFTLYNPLISGHWVGKAFCPESETSGHGYNMFRRLGHLRRVIRMKTEVAASQYDGREAFRLDYSVYRSPAALVNMADEVRKVQDGLYLGIGTWGFTRAQRMAQWPFVLTGPVGEFVGPDRAELK